MSVEWVIVGLLVGFLSLNAAGLVLVSHYAPKLIEALRARHTYSTLAGIEDGTAVNKDTVMEVLALREYLLTGYNRLEAIERRLQDQLKILQVTREGPHAYDPDRPAGRRPNGMDD